MQILKNLIALLALVALGLLIFAEIKFMVVVALLLVGVWLYLDFAFDNKEDGG